jgi:hypothetical protein
MVEPLNVKAGFKGAMAVSSPKKLSCSTADPSGHLQDYTKARLLSGRINRHFPVIAWIRYINHQISYLKVVFCPSMKRFYVSMWFKEVFLTTPRVNF